MWTLRLDRGLQRLHYQAEVMRYWLMYDVVESMSLYFEIECHREGALLSQCIYSQRREMLCASPSASAVTCFGPNKRHTLTSFLASPMNMSLAEGHASHAAETVHTLLHMCTRPWNELLFAHDKRERRVSLWVLLGLIRILRQWSRKQRATIARSITGIVESRVYHCSQARIGKSTIYPAPWTTYLNSGMNRNTVNMYSCYPAKRSIQTLTLESSCQ